MHPHPLTIPLPTLPLYGAHVRAGFPSPADDYIERRLNLQEYLVPCPAATFFLKAGELCREAGVRPGDLLVVDRSLKPQPGRVAVVVSEGTMKVCVLPSEGPELEVWGVVSYVIHPIKGVTPAPLPPNRGRGHVRAG